MSRRRRGGAGEGRGDRSDRTLTRREILAAGAAAAGYALAAGPARSEVVRTDSEGLTHGVVRIPTREGEIPAYRAAPAEASSPSVILVAHEIFGIHEYIRDVCRRLAKLGYFAIAPHLFERQGDPRKLEQVDQIIEQIVGRVNDAQVLSDLDATLAWVRRKDVGDAERAAITGFCWGGRIAWLYAAHNPRLRASVAWYGRLRGASSPLTPRHPLDQVRKLKAPVLGLYGSADSGIPLGDVDAMRAELLAAGNSSEIVIFPGAPHGFHADYRDSYRALAATEGWRRMAGWFKRHGVVPWRRPPLEPAPKLEEPAPPPEGEAGASKAGVG